MLSPAWCAACDTPVCVDPHHQWTVLCDGDAALSCVQGMNVRLDGILGFSGVKHKFVCMQTGLFVMYVSASVMMFVSKQGCL